MLTITLLKCDQLSKELSLENQYRDYYQSLYYSIDPSLPPDYQAEKIEEQAFEMSLKLNLNSVGISERKTFVIRREPRYIDHPFCIGNFVIEDNPGGFVENLKMLYEDEETSIEKVFDFKSYHLIEGLYFQPDWLKISRKINELVEKVSLPEVSIKIKNYELFAASLKIIKSTIDLVMRQNDRDHYYFQWIYN